MELRTDKLKYISTKIDGENTEIYNNPDTSLNTLQRRDEYIKNFDLASSIRLRLNMSAQLNKNTQFHGRMIFMHSSQSNQRVCILSRDIKMSKSLSAFDVDKAYFDYSPDNSFTFSFGLLPTSGGTPMNYANNTKRKSMFPALVFDMNTYGIIGTQKFHETTFLRAILAKAYSLRTNFYPYQCNRENIDNANVFGLYLDSKFDFFGKALLSFGVNMLHNFKARPYLGADIDTSESQVLGDIITYGIGIDIENFATTQTTIFLHGASSHPHPNGVIEDYQIVNSQDGTTEDGSIGFSEAEYAKGAMLSESGFSIYLGAKYDLKKDINFGIEYNYGTKYWFSATQGAEDMYNKLATRGHVGELYSSWQFTQKIYTKLGYLYTKENYTGSGWHFGEPAKKDATQEVVYLSIVAKF